MTATFKAKLAAAQPCIVLNPDHPSASLVEFVGRLGIDAVMIDTEQGGPGIESVEHMARAARLAGIASLVRVFSPEDWVIERTMLRGVDGIVVPRIDTPDEARRVVECVRYCFPERHGEKTVVVQIETRHALERLHEFIAIEGIDCLFFGPVDLAKSLGAAGRYREPTVLRAIERAIADVVAGGRAAGMLVTPTDVGEWLAQRVSFLYLHANDFLRLGSEAFKERMREATP